MIDNIKGTLQKNCEVVDLLMKMFNAIMYNDCVDYKMQ